MTRSRSSRAIAPLLVSMAIAAGFAASCGGNSSHEMSRQEVMTALTNDVMVPTYQEVAADTDELLAAVIAACDSRQNAATMDTARVAWGDARASWLATRSFRFGPATTLRTMPTIDFPIDTAKVDKLLAGGDPITPESLAQLGADQRGLEGIEYVLFADDSLDDRSCSYGTSAAQLVSDAASQVLVGWTDGIDGGPSFASQLTNPGQAGAMYANEHAAYEELVNSMIFAIADIADARIGRASGDVTGTPVPDEVDAGRAHRAKQDAIDVVAGVRALYDGAHGGPGLRDVVASISRDTADTMSADLANALAALDMLTEPLSDSIDPAPAHDAYEALKKVQLTLRAEVASQLGVTLTFGDADGDS